MHFDNVNYIIELVKHHSTWFLDELLDLLEANHFIAAHYTTIHHELVHVGVTTVTSDHPVPYCPIASCVCCLFIVCTPLFRFSLSVL